MACHKSNSCASNRTDWIIKKTSHTKEKSRILVKRNQTFLTFGLANRREYISYEGIFRKLYILMLKFILNLIQDFWFWIKKKSQRKLRAHQKTYFKIFPPGISVSKNKLK